MTDKPPFNASRDLSPEDFKLFSAQHVNAFIQARNGLDDARRMIKRAEQTASFWARRINEHYIDAARHGVELPE